MTNLPKRARLSAEAEINIVPYIDVMLVLLVIFMMTTPIIEQGIEVELPAAKSEIVDFSERQPTIITVNKAGEYFINSLDAPGRSQLEDGEKLPLDVIAGRVRARLEIYPQMQIFVRGDRAAEYGLIVSLMSFLQQNGVEKVGMITESPDVAP